MVSVHHSNSFDMATRTINASVLHGIRDLRTVRYTSYIEIDLGTDTPSLGTT